MYVVEEAEWDPELDRMLWTREKSSASAGNRTLIP
jgi:hypothetical protein